MHLDFLRSRSMLFLYFILLVFAPFTISAQDVPIDVSPSVVDSGQTVFVRTAGGATCFWDATDGTSGQVTADANGDILFGIANPPGTTISIFCRLNNQSSATVSITVRDDAQPDPVDPGQPDPGIAPPPPPPPPPPPGFICAASPDVAMHVEPDSNAPIFSFMQPAYVQFDVLDQVQNSSGLWYQVAPDGMWVRSDQVLRDDPSCDDQPLEQPYAIEHAPERITLVQERLEVLGCPGLTDTVLDNFTDSQILVFIYSPNACEYFDNSFNQMEQPPEPWISSQAQQDLFAECRQDALVVATFIDIMGGLESGTRADMRRLLDTVDPCEFARTLVTEQRLLGLDGSYRLSSALEPIIATCIPNYSTLRMRHTITTMRFVLDITMEDVIGGVDDPCVLVESLMSLGILTSEESDLFDTLLVCEDIGEASALELLTYAKSMGLDAAEILAEFEANEAYCDDLIAGFNTNPIDPDDLTAEETRHIGQIAGATEACMTDTEGELDTNAYIALVMMAWQHWDDLTLLQQIGLLTADDPCIAIENFILNGIAPPAPVVESGTILPPVNSSFVTEVLGGQELAETLADVPDYNIFIGSIPALGVFVSENGTIVDIHSVIEGSESRIPKEYEANFVQPTVDPSGEYIAYIDLEANELWMFEIDAPDNGSRLILSPDELGLPGLQLADYPMSWAPSSAIENQTLLVTFTDDDGIPAIWDVHPFDESAPLGDELVAYAVSPSYSMSGAAFAFTQIDPETGLRSVRSAGILPSGAVDADDIDNIPEGATECFAPGYNVTDVDVEWLTIYYTCLVDGELQYYRYAQSGGEPERLFLETDYQSLSGMERLVPGPASDHLAFDHEGVIYLTYLTDNDDPDDTDNNRITEVLLQLEPLSLRDISWAFNR